MSTPVPASPPPLMRPAGVSPPAEADSPDEGAGLDVAGEAALLNRTKVAIDGEQWSVAARRLGEYRRRYPAGVLAPEARALDVVVACGREATGAQDRARQFLNANPGSSLRERVRRSCGLDS